MRSFHSRSGSARTIVLVVSIAVVVVGIVLIVAMRWATVRNWFDRDRENAEELTRLAAAPAKSAPPAPAALGWPQWRGPMRDGRAPESPLRTDWQRKLPEQLWKVKCGGGYSSLAVVGQRAYTQDRDGSTESVLCFDVETGRTIWKHQYPANYSGISYGAGPRATPTLDGSKLYAVGAAGKCLCLDLTGGDVQPPVVWEHDFTIEFSAAVPQWGFASSPLVEGDLIIVQPGGKNASVVAFDKVTGAERWRAGNHPNGYSSPVAATIGGVRVVFALTGDTLLCIRAVDGVVLASVEWITEHKGNIATPLIHEDYVFISSGYSKGCALFRAAADGDSVKLHQVYMRKNRVMRNHHSTCVYKDGFLFGFDDSRLRCVNFRTGIEQDGWDDSLFNAKGSVILAGNHLIVLTESGELALLEATEVEARLIARMPSGLGGRENWSLPVLVDGRLLLRNSEAIVCFDVR